MARAQKLSDISVTPATLERELKDNRVANVYLFSGEEELMKAEALATLKAKLLPEGFEMLNETVLNEASAGQIIDACETFPVMADRRVVIVRDWAPLMKGKSADEENEVKKIVEWMAHAPETSALVFYFRGELYEKGKLTETFKQAIRDKKLTSVLFTRLQGNDLVRYFGRWLKPRKKAISTEAANRLILMAGTDLTTLTGELDKLAAYVGDRAQIEEDDVARIASPNADYNAFELTNLLLEGKVGEAQQMAGSLLQMGENATGMISLLTLQLRQYSVLTEALAKGENLKQIENQTRLPEYRLRRMSQVCRGKSVEALRRCFQMSVEADLSVKSGKARDVDALRVLLYKVAETFSKNGNQKTGSRV